MKAARKVSDIISKISEIICILMIAGLVLVIVLELINRNIFNSSNRATIEICGIEFLWMAFIGLISLYHNHGLMRLDFVVARAKGFFGEFLYFLNKIVSLTLGVVMVIAFIAQYPYVSTRFYSTFSFKLPYTIQYVPMAIAGAYIALETVRHIIERIIFLVSGKTSEEDKTVEVG